MGFNFEMKKCFHKNDTKLAGDVRAIPGDSCSSPSWAVVRHAYTHDEVALTWGLATYPLDHLTIPRPMPGGTHLWIMVSPCQGRMNR